MNYFDAGHYDIIVVGAGHAGCEAALIAAKMELKVLLVGLSMESVAYMPCNPSVGGTGKGQLVREIDALGGYMGINTDKSTINARMLNYTKGPAVHSLRAQVDKNLYHRNMKKHIEDQKNIDMVMDEATELISENGRVFGIMTRLGAKYFSKAVILATGVYLDSKVYIGEVNFPSGPLGLTGAYELSKSLKKLNLPLRKFKTGTPARVNAGTIDFSKMQVQHGDEKITPFSFITRERLENKIDCYLTRTNLKTHQIILDNLDKSALFRGDMHAVAGARYCPSIEDKVTRFRDKDSHQFFVEPEGLDTKEYYIQGFSSSLSYQVQLEMYHTVAGLEHCHVIRPAYAIEYDCVDPLCLDASLKVMDLEGLYMAGQINSTSGYEEAAAQGIIAGINAAAFVKNLPPLIITRDMGYIGVLIDDLTTKGTNEPYRMMTSRAEYRLILRQDNADRRLTPLAEKYGLIDQNRREIFEEKYRKLEEFKTYLENTRIDPENINALLEQKGKDTVNKKLSLKELLKRPEIDFKLLEEAGFEFDVPDEIKNAAQTSIKYKGYIDKSLRNIENFKKLESKKLSYNLDYQNIKGLRIEAAQKLARIKPASIGQASRISGVSPADISVLLVYLKK